MLNDTPVACQTRGPTDPQGDRWHGEAETDEVSPRSGVKLPVPPAGGVPHTPAALAATYPLRCFAPQWARFDNRHSISAPAPILSLHQRQRRRDSFAPRRELLLSAVTKVAKSTGRNYVSALPQRAMPVHCHPRFPSRNRRFPDRCRSPDCASTAFRCRCPLLR